MFKRFALTSTVAALAAFAPPAFADEMKVVFNPSPEVSGEVVELQPGQSPACAASDNKGCSAFIVTAEFVPIGDTMFRNELKTLGPTNGIEGTLTLNTRLMYGMHIFVDPYKS